MKNLLLTISLIISNFAYTQSSRNELTNSKIYVRATYFNQKNDFIGLQTRTDLTDTIIQDIKYKKYQTDNFTDYAGNRSTEIFYESFFNGSYSLLDQKLNTVHKIDFNKTNEQNGIIFGNQVPISIEFLDTRNSYPRDSLIPTEKTPRKYYQKENSEVYLVIIPDLKTIAVSSNGQFYTKQLFGDNYNDITKGLQNMFHASTKYEIQKGDEIQLFYRRKWYNDTTNLAVYEDKQFKNIKYLRDTIVNKNKALEFEIEGYNYLSGSKEGPETFLSYVTDSGYYVGQWFIPFKNYNTELKLIEIDGTKQYFLQGVTFDTVGTNIYPKIVQAKSNDPYRYFILPFFPMPFIEFGNVQGLITYSKIKGIEHGRKRERTYITDKTNIREIISKSKNEVEVVLYSIENAEIEIEIQDYESNKKLGYLKSIAKSGINKFDVRTSNQKKGIVYRVQLSYKGTNSSGSFLDSVKSL